MRASRRTAPANVVAVPRSPIVYRAQNKQTAGQQRKPDQRFRPPDLACNFHNRIRATQQNPLARDQTHLAKEILRRDAKVLQPLANVRLLQWPGYNPAFGHAAVETAHQRGAECALAII
jgi:hypothetical protein